MRFPGDKRRLHYTAAPASVSPSTVTTWRDCALLVSINLGLDLLQVLSPLKCSPEVSSPPGLVSG